MTSMSASTSMVVSASVVVPAAVTPAMAAVVTVPWSVVIAEAEIQFDWRADIRGVAAAIIRIVAGVRRSIHRASAESCSQ